MRTARIANRAAQEAVAGPIGLDGGHCPDGYTEAAIDALIEDVDRALTTGASTAVVRVSRAFTDVRSARRAERRAGRASVRALSARVDAAEVAGEVAA